jgi:isoleucyl-tRNA synthetase
VRFRAALLSKIFFADTKLKRVPSEAAGWDTHGLPVELGTEKELGITKEDIGTKISIEEYNEACKKTVMRYTDVWNDLTEKWDIGRYGIRMLTYKPKYMESVVDFENKSIIKI